MELEAVSAEYSANEGISLHSADSRSLEKRLNLNVFSSWISNLTEHFWNNLNHRRTGGKWKERILFKVAINIIEIKI